MNSNNEPKTKGKIYQAILKVYSQVGYVQKTGENTMQKYRYASEADFIAAIRPAMIEAGIITYPAEIERHYETINEVDSYGKVKPKFHVSNIYKFRFVHVESGEFIDVYAVGEGIGGDDKSSYKAATGAQKYAMRQAFLIETGDDPDQDNKEDYDNKNIDPKNGNQPPPKNNGKNTTPPKPQGKEPNQKAIPIPPLASGKGTDWEGYGKVLIDAITAIKTRGELTAFPIANEVGLKKLLEVNPDLRAKISAIATAKLKEIGAGKKNTDTRKPPPPPPADYVGGNAHA